MANERNGNGRREARARIGVRKDEAMSDDARKMAAEGEREDRPTSVLFEEALQELDEIVSALEDGQLTLDDALKLFERGVLLARECQQVLDNAELRVQRLRLSDVDSAEHGSRGEFLLETFEIEER